MGTMLPRFVGIVTVLGLSVGAASAAQPDIPQNCDTIARFEPPARVWVDDRHRQAVSVLALTPGAERARLAQISWETLSGLYNRAVAEHGEASGEAAILRADIADMAVASNDTAFRETAVEQKKIAIDLLYKHADNQAEADYLLRLGDDFNLRLTLQQKLAVAQRYRQIAGDRLDLFAFMYKAITEDRDAEVEARSAVADLMSEVAASLDNRRARYSADALRMRILAEAAQTSQAGQIAGRIIGEAKARLERAFTSNAEYDNLEVRRQCWTENRVMEVANELLKDRFSHAEMEANYRFESIETALFGELQTDFYGASFAFAKLMDLRDIDRATYRSVMEFFARINADTSSGEHFGAGEIAAMGGDIHVSLVIPSIAYEFFQDADEWSRDAPPARRLDVLSRVIQFEWNEGRTGQLPEHLAEARSLIEVLADNAPIGPRLALLLVDAEYNEALLNDDQAGAAFAEAVDLALEVEDYTSQGGKSLEIALGNLAGKVEAFLQGRFCGSCGDAMRQAVARYWKAENDRFLANTSISSFGFFELAIQMAASAEKRGVDVKQDEIDETLRAISESQIYEMFEPLGAWLADSNLNDGDRLRVLVLAIGWIGENILYGDFDSADFARMLSERDLPTKRKLMHTFTALAAASAGAFGADISAFESLQSLAALLDEMNYPLASRVVNEQILDLADPKLEWQDWDAPDEHAKLRLARIFSASHAKAARDALETNETDPAKRHAEEAVSLVARRLAGEWRVGNERAGILYRALRPALTDAAAAQFDLAIGSRDGEAAGQAFATVQYAMLGDTALAMQSAIRRRVTKDEDLRAAINERDEARLEIERIDAMEQLAPSKLPWRTKAIRAAAVERETAASAIIAEKLEISEDFAALRAISAEEAAGALRPGEALALFHVGETRVRAFVLRPAREPLLYAVEIGREALSEMITRLRADAAGLGNVDIGNAAALHEILLGPAEDYLDSVEHLIVVADGPLPGLPWPMLLTEAFNGTAGVAGSSETSRGASPLGGNQSGAAGAAWKDMPWLLRRFPISLAPNVASLVAQRLAVPRTSAGKPFLGVGNPLLAGGGGAVRGGDIASFFTRGSPDATALSRLAPLPETAFELKALAATLGAGDESILLGESATETTLGTLELADYRVVAFATHGILAGEIDGSTEPGLVLTKGGGADDGYLALSEIMQLGFDAELVILSACNTGGADGRPRSEWLSGLARGFIAGGARQLAVTLWSIPSEPTTRLTTGMAAHHERTGEPWPKALQASMLAMIDDPEKPIDAHPGSWAAFVILGAGNQAAN